MVNNVAIIIPGIMGSVLKDGDDVVWPGNVSELLLPYNKMKQLLKPDLQPSDIIRKVSISEQYNDLIDSLEACGFNENPANSQQPQTLFVCPYDWRKSNEEAAARLAHLIDETIYPLHNGDMEIFLIAHSMGGLVSRYYLESGKFNGRGFKTVKNLITLATPHHGAALALTAITGMEKRLFLSAAQVKTLANDSRYPAVYQLLPPPGEAFVWNANPESRLAPVDIYDSEIYKPLALLSESLKSAQDFHGNLDLAKKPKGVKYFFFYGTQQATISTIYFTKTVATPQLSKLELNYAGDGTVPVWSGMQSGIQGIPVGGEHGTIYKNGLLKSSLATLLGKKGVLAQAGRLPEIAIKDHVVAPDTTTHVVITFPDPINTIQARIVFSRMVDAKGAEIREKHYIKDYPVNYSGTPTDMISLVIDAPGYTGAYKVELIIGNNAAPVASDELFVQEQ